MFKKYIYNILISLDQLGNTILFGDPDETISSRLGKNYRGTWIERLVDWMFYDGHCENAEEKDEGKDTILAIKNNKNNV
jgi:hypothetical protein